MKSKKNPAKIFLKSNPQSADSISRAQKETIGARILNTSKEGSLTFMTTVDWPAC